MSKQTEILVIGGGPAGLAAAVSAKKNGIESILILERDRRVSLLPVPPPSWEPASSYVSAITSPAVS